MIPEHQPRSHDARYVFGYLLEIYTYLVLANSITPYGIMDSRHVPYDDFVDNLVMRLSNYDTFGIMFAGCHELFELIPAISRFASQRLKEEEQATTAASLPNSETFYASTNTRIHDWQQRQPDESKADRMSERWAIGEIYRHAMFIYLETAMLGTAGLPADADIHIRLQKHIMQIAGVFLEHDLVTSMYATILLWPMAIMGSVLLQVPERELLIQGLRAPQYATFNSIQLAELLQLLWVDKDPRSFGPYGLYVEMERHGINLCLS
jgi:Fungal specific transcription factor domain